MRGDTGMSNNISIPGISQNGFNKLIILHSREDYKIDKFEKSKIHLREARLIPKSKSDKNALLSVFLSALRLVDEFSTRFLVSSELISIGEIYVYTEVIFPNFPDFKIDGLLLVVVGGTIKDASILKVNINSDKIEQDHIEIYKTVAKEFNIHRLITISNQLTSDTKQFPTKRNISEKIKMFHYSWAYLHNLAQYLLLNNEIYIEDSDQVEILKEVLHYFETPDSGVLGFINMRSSWNDLDK